MTMIENDVSEHKYYRLGSQFFSNPESEQNDVKLKIISTLFGEHWQKIRFHNLVRLGGDIQASGLGEYHKATIMGAFLAYSKSE